METQRLVLEAGPGGWVALRRKQYGDRAQLWRMTGDGQLQHEGSFFLYTVYTKKIIIMTLMLAHHIVILM